MKTFLIAISTLVALSATAQTVTTPTACYQTDQLVADLRKEHSEFPRGTGMSAAPDVITTVWVSAAGGYTITRSHTPSNVSCVIDVGTGFRAVSSAPTKSL